MHTFYCGRGNLFKPRLESSFGAGPESKHFVATTHANLHEHRLEDIFGLILFTPSLSLFSYYVTVLFTLLFHRNASAPEQHLNILGPSIV